MGGAGTLARTARPHTHRRLGRVAAFVVLVAAYAGPLACRASAQSNQRLSFQVSGLFAKLQGSAYGYMAPGLGGEAQLRLTSGALSIGAGVQHTRHEFGLAGAVFLVGLTGPFVEPRYVVAVPLRDVGLYVSTRFSLLRQHYDAGAFRGASTGVTLNGGGGALLRLGGRTNLDVGATYGFTSFGAFRIRDQDSGQRYSIRAGSGSNLVVRIGLAIGIAG
jgi:hypothetical protein